MKPVDKDVLLRDWAKLNAALMEMGEGEVRDLLEYEKANRARIRFMLRLYHRFSKLRGTREKVELMGCARG